MITCRLFSGMCNFRIFKCIMLLIAILGLHTHSAIAQASDRRSELGNLSDQIVEKIKQKQAHIPFDRIKPYLPFCYELSNDPVFEGFSLKVPSELGNQALAQMGMVDVTAAPFHADASGKNDATQALQQAINYARDHQMVCYLPLGTYKVSDTLECIQNLSVRQNGRIVGAPQYPCILIGSSKTPGKRPVITLDNNSKGFNDPDQRKQVVLFWSRNYGTELRGGPFTAGPDMPQANIGFNQTFMGIDIQIGSGNGGAIGITMRAAEGSSIQDVNIDATHGHTGMLGISGSGGSHHNITVLGGKIGIDVRGNEPQFNLNKSGSQPGPTLSNIHLLHQTHTPIITRATGSLTIVGLTVKSNLNGPMIEVLEMGWPTCGGTVSIIESQFIFEKPGKNLVCTLGRGAVFENVYVRNAHRLADDIKLNGNGWSHISRAAIPKPIGELDVHQVGKVEQVEFPYINGKRQDQNYIQAITSQSPPSDLCSKHGWSEDFPSWQTPGAVNVKMPPYNAKGDSYTDDTQAIQRAIDENQIVFLPKGYYRITDTLKLKADTQLIGLIHPLTVIMVRDSWGKLASSKPMPLVSSPDNADATTTVAFMSLDVCSSFDKRKNPANTAGLYGLNWQSGQRSMVRQVVSKFSKGEDWNKHDFQDVGFLHPWAHVTGHGGGRWYNFHINERLSEFKPEYRHLLVENTTTPLSVYHLHAQHNVPSYGAEFRNASNIAIYGCKQEIIGKAPFMKIDTCTKVKVFGLSGWAMPMPGEANFSINHSDDFLIACYAPFQETRKPTEFKKKGWIDYPVGKTNIKEIFPIVETTVAGQQIKVSPFDAPILYLRGNP